MAAEARKEEGYVCRCRTRRSSRCWFLEVRATRQALFDDSWDRAERGGENDTRETIAQIAKLRAEKAKLLGFRTSRRGD